MALQGARSRLAVLSRRLGSNPATTTAPASSHARSLSSFNSSDSEDEKPITCTLFPGDGIGPEIALSVKEVSEFAAIESKFWVKWVNFGIRFCEMGCDQREFPGVGSRDPSIWNGYRILGSGGILVISVMECWFWFSGCGCWRVWVEVEMVVDFEQLV
jgi:hypothetical protein